MPHQQGDFRRLRLVGNQRFIDIFHQRFRHVLRHLGGGKQRVLIAVLQLRQHAPLLVGFDFSPGDLVGREAFVILQRERIHQRVAHLQRPGYARLFFIVGAEGIFRVRQRADLFLFAGRRVGVVRHLLQQLIAFAKLHFLPFRLHRLQRFFAEFRRIIGDHRIKCRIHGAHFFLMVHGHIAARERAGDKELRGGDGALQAVSIGVNALRRWTFSRLHHPLLRQPLAHVMAHIDLQHAPFGCELAARHLPLRPLLRRGLLQHAAVVSQRRTQVMATHD